MPLPDERPRPSVANLIGKFETTSQKRNSASSPAGVAGAPGSPATAPLPRKPSTGAEDATSPRAIAQQLTGNDSSVDGAGASEKPTTSAAQEDAGSDVPGSTPTPTNGKNGTNYNDGVQLSISDSKVPDVHEVPPTPLTEQPDALPVAEEPAPTTSSEPSVPAKKPPASPKKPGAPLNKPTTARPRPSTATSSTPKPSTTAAVAPKPKPTTGSMGKPPVAITPRAPRPGSTASNATARPSSAVRATTTTSRPPVTKPSAAPKAASTTLTPGSTIARKTPTGSGSTLTPGAAPAKKPSTSSLRPSATASSSTAAAGSGAGGAVSLRKSVSGKPSSSSTTSTKPATGATPNVRRPATSTTSSTTTTSAAAVRKPRVGLLGPGRVKDPATSGKATTAAATQKGGALGGKGNAAAIAAGSTAVVGNIVPAEEAKPEQGAEDERGVPVEGDPVIPIEVSSEELHDASEEHHEVDVEVQVSGVDSHEEGGSAPASPPIEGEEIHFLEGGVREDEVSDPPPVSGSDHEHEHEHGHEHEPEYEHEHVHEHSGEEEHGSPQLSEELQEELLKGPVAALPTLSVNDIAEATGHPGVEEHLEKVVPPYQPSVLPTGEQIDEEKRGEVEGLPDDA